MAAFAFVLVTLLASIHIETTVGSMGVLAPVTALAVFYFSTTFGWRAGVIAGVFGGAALDAIYGRPFPGTSTEMVVVAAMGRFWLHKGDPSSLLPNLIPGAAVAFVVSFPQLAWNAWSVNDFFRDTSLLLFCVGFGAFALPLMIQVLDYFSGKFSLPKYKTARADAKSGTT